MPRHSRQRHDPSKNLVGFIVGDVTYAVHIQKVREIANPLTIVELPKAPSSIGGVAEYRGDVVPVIDMRIRFGLPPAPASRRTKWIILDVGDRFAALVVDAVTDVFGTGGSELRPAPALGGGEDTRGIAGVTNYEGTLVFVLDVARFTTLTDALVVQGQISAGSRLPSLLPRAGGS
jgi:purine-binding chemotaxis protein CheW